MFAAQKFDFTKQDDIDYMTFDQYPSISVDYAVMIIAAVIPLLLGFTGRINRLSGTIMLLGFIGYTWYLLSGQIA